MQAHDLTANSLSANPPKWSNTLKQFVGSLPTNCLSVFDHFVKLERYTEDKHYFEDIQSPGTGLYQGKIN